METLPRVLVGAGSCKSPADAVNSLVLQFDFGPSLYSYPRPVTEFIWTALPWTLGLLGVSIVIGNFIGLLAGFFHNSRFATTLEVVGVVLYPIPYYILALVLILQFAYIWQWFPLSTTIRPGPLTWKKVNVIIYNSFLPAMTLILAGFGWNILSMKALAFATKEEPYVVFARLKSVATAAFIIDLLYPLIDPRIRLR